MEIGGWRGGRAPGGALGQVACGGRALAISEHGQGSGIGSLASGHQLESRRGLWTRINAGGGAGGGHLLGILCHCRPANGEGRPWGNGERKKNPKYKKTQLVGSGGGGEGGPRGCASGVGLRHMDGGDNNKQHRRSSGGGGQKNSG